MASLVGKTLKNRYRVDAFLGRGGMAEVYKVWDTRRGVPLAMKVLRDDLAEDVVFMRRFEREAVNLTRLQHPNIVRCYGLEREGRTAYMLMDYIDGWTLRSEIFDAHGALPLQRIIEVIQPVCSALNYAHQMGMVHCDVKSANIMIHKNGMVYLTDFGIARGMDAATSTMVGIGTPAYMAPELIKGQDPTPQTDIYALGIVLYEMLTGGERPFTGERATITGTTAEKVHWEHLKLDPISIREINENVSVNLEKIVATCMQKNKQERFADASEVSKALQEEYEQHISEYQTSYVYQPIEEVQDTQYHQVDVNHTREESEWNLNSPKNVFARYGIGVVVILLLILGMNSLSNSVHTSPDYSTSNRQQATRENVVSVVEQPTNRPTATFFPTRPIPTATRQSCPGAPTQRLKKMRMLLFVPNRILLCFALDPIKTTRSFAM